MTPQQMVTGSRAAAALRLCRYDVAAADAQHAAERDPGCRRSLVRGGRAQLGLRRPAEAASLFRKALQLNPDERAAQARARELPFATSAALSVAQRAAAALALRTARDEHVTEPVVAWVLR